MKSQIPETIDLVPIINDMDSPFLSTIPTVVVEGSTSEGSSHEQSRKSGN